MVGCNRLHCVTCREAVRFDRDPVPAGRDFRTYSCRCTTHQQYSGLRSAADDDAQDRWLPWRCAGHPAATLPLGIDGVEIAEQTDLVALVRRSLEGWSPGAARPAERQSPNGWVIKLHVRLIGTGREEAVSRAVAECATDPDPRVRAAALSFLALHPVAPGAERVESLVTGERGPFAGVANPLAPGGTIEEALLLVLGRRAVLQDAAGVAIAPRARDLAREEVLRPGRGAFLLDFMARYDEGWLVENAGAIARASEGGWEALLDALEDSDQQGEVGARLASVPGVDLAALRRYARKRARGPARATILAAVGPAGPRGRRG